MIKAKVIVGEDVKLDQIDEWLFTGAISDAGFLKRFDVVLDRLKRECAARVTKIGDEVGFGHDF